MAKRICTVQGIVRVSNYPLLKAYAQNLKRITTWPALILGSGIAGVNNGGGGDHRGWRLVANAVVAISRGATAQIYGVPNSPQWHHSLHRDVADVAYR